MVSVGVCKVVGGSTILRSGRHNCRNTKGIPVPNVLVPEEGGGVQIYKLHAEKAKLGP